MGANATLALANLIESSDGTRRWLNYILYPLGGLLIALGLFFLLRSFGLLGGQKSEATYNRVSHDDSSYLKAINEDDDKESNYTRSD